MMLAVESTQAATIVSALAAFTGLQALRISRSLDRVHATLDRLDTRLDRVAGVVLRDHGERIARLGPPVPTETAISR